MAHAKRRKRVMYSFKLAWQGIIYVLSSQLNMKIHFVCALMALLLAIWVDLAFAQFIWVLFSIFFVLCMETVNTAIERAIDLITSDYHPLAKLAKDVSAGVVLFASLFAALTGLLVFTEPVLNRVGLKLPFSLNVIVAGIVILFLGVVSIFGWRKGGRHGSRFFD
jgi:diacylglycerol kinase